MNVEIYDPSSCAPLVGFGILLATFSCYLLGRYLMPEKLGITRFELWLYPKFSDRPTPSSPGSGWWERAFRCFGILFLSMTTLTFLLFTGFMVWACWITENTH